MSGTDHTIRPASGSHVTVRVAVEEDARTLEQLAALDSAAVPAGPALVAEIDGEAAAALPILGGPGVADPFRRTSAALELLELRAAQLRRHERTATSATSYGERLRALTRMPRAVRAR